MIFTETKLAGAFIIDLKKLEDERGFFARTFCSRELEEHGLISNVEQANMSWNEKAGTMRGMHYQVDPYQETKLVRCTRGALYDVIIDLRKDSPTYREWIGVELTADNRRALFVPRDFAHGFVTLEDNTDAFYMVSQSYVPGAEAGIRWNDPQFAIDWPVKPTVVSEKDANWADYKG
ncbi:MAG: dTDP-4-dehydrorhamnose 3,5-epimerase [Gammaproteobacteria bacterium]|nr:dTDP-4-dehydrorhamnose 3,5-epimerase [Gammaproteobacteria bacterium]